MAGSSHNDSGNLTSFVTANHYVIGAGETIEEIQVSGEWVKTDDPVDVRR